MYYTIQGEGRNTGRAMIFCRFAGCNLWTGREKDRLHAVCRFCDTDFVGTDGINGGKYEASELKDKILSLWPTNSDCQVSVVFTGGEPALQLDDALIHTFKDANIYMAIETNGTIELPLGIDWICVSPKGDSIIRQTTGHELKLVYPQPENHPEQFIHLSFENFYIQPLEDENWEKNTALSIEFVKNNPQWRLSIQTHKYLHIP